VQWVSILRYSVLAGLPTDIGSLTTFLQAKNLCQSVTWAGVSTPGLNESVAVIGPIGGPPEALTEKGLPPGVGGQVDPGSESARRKLSEPVRVTVPFGTVHAVALWTICK